MENNSKTIYLSVFNNKGGVGKTSITWNLAISLAEKNKNVLLIDFDPQCNLSIATLGSPSFSALLKNTTNHPLGQTIKSFVLPYVQQNIVNDFDVFLLKDQPSKGSVHIIPGDFWLNNFADTLNVGTDVISGSGMYRFLLPETLAEKAMKKYGITYDYVLIDVPPSFNTLVRSALYSSDYFLVPCTPDMFSAYCVGLIGEMLPIFVDDWEQGKKRYLYNNPADQLITKKGMPKFGGWIYNGFDKRKNKTTGIVSMNGADAIHHDEIRDAVRDKLIAPLAANIKSYNAAPGFVSPEKVGGIEDLNVMAPDSIVQNISIPHLHKHKPTTALRGRGSWALNQIDLMKEASKEYNKISDHIIKNFL